MSPSADVPRPSTTHELLRQDTLPLSAVADLVPPELRRRADGSDPFDSVPEGWGPYYQSMVRKAASTRSRWFRFDQNGAFAPDTAADACNSLCAWLGLTSESDVTTISRWLKDGTPLNTGLFRQLRHKLGDEMLVEADLYDRPICRLVQVDQLRYDPDYTAVYQLTPAQVRLVDDQHNRPNAWAADAAPDLSELERIRANQRMYWMISERFQSSIALFDSDLGKDEPDAEGTKNLLHITDPRDPEGKATAPGELNLYSPLRFWSPPPAFARYVFHMLFWQPLVTGRDLYGRPFTGSIEERVARFRVAVNVYNSSKYRIADYAELLRLIESLTRAIGGGVHPDTPLAELKDIPLDESVFCPGGFVHKPPVQLPRGHVSLPLRSLGEQRWELASRYQQPGEPTTVGHLRCMFRDRALEIVLWSRYQMEIRSVGMVPVQRVYRVALDDEAMKFVKHLQDLCDRERHDDLDREFSEAVFSGALERRVTLHKEYDRHGSRVLRDDSAIEALDSRCEPASRPSYARVP